MYPDRGQYEDSPHLYWLVFRCFKPIDSEKFRLVGLTERTKDKQPVIFKSTIGAQNFKDSIALEKQQEMMPSVNLMIAMSNSMMALEICLTHVNPMNGSIHAVCMFRPMPMILDEQLKIELHPYYFETKNGTAVILGQDNYRYVRKLVKGK